jgi:hypothetical protein
MGHESWPHRVLAVDRPPSLSESRSSFEQGYSREVVRGKVDLSLRKKLIRHACPRYRSVLTPPFRFIACPGWPTIGLLTRLRCHKLLVRRSATVADCDRLHSAALVQKVLYAHGSVQEGSS